MSKPRNPIAESIFRYQQAQEALIQAAERICYPPTRERRSEALFYATLAADQPAKEPPTP